MKPTHILVPIDELANAKEFYDKFMVISKSPKVDLSEEGIRATATRLCTDANDGSLHNVGMAYAIGALKDLLNTK